MATQDVAQSIVSLLVRFLYLKHLSPQNHMQLHCFVNQHQTQVLVNIKVQISCHGLASTANNFLTFVFFSHLSTGAWFWGRGQRTRLNEFQAKCPRSQGRAPRQRMAKQSMRPLASSTPIRANLWKPRKLQVSPPPTVIPCQLCTLLLGLGTELCTFYGTDRIMSLLQSTNSC